MATGGVFVGGGIAPKILLKLEEELFLNAFIDNPDGVDLTSDTYGDYYGALLRFKVPGDRGGVLRLL